jgi:hypothetical protein
VALAVFGKTALALVSGTSFTLVAIDGDYARLDLIENSVPLTDLSLVQKLMSKTLRCPHCP